MSKRREGEEELICSSQLNDKIERNGSFGAVFGLKYREKTGKSFVDSHIHFITRRRRGAALASPN